MAKANNDLTKLNKLIQELEDNFDEASNINPKISSSNIGWHLDHSLRVITEISNFVKNSDPNVYRKTFNLKRSLVFIFRFIPRGVAKAPKIVRPIATISKESLEKQLHNTRTFLQELIHLDANKNFKHPYFDYLNVKQTINFLEIHTYHHLKIMRDIKKDK